MPFVSFDSEPQSPGFVDFDAPVKPPEQTGVLNEIARGLSHGAQVTLPRSAGEAAKFFGAEKIGNALIDSAQARETEANRESAYGQSLDSPYSVRGNIYEAADNSVLSLAPGAAGAAVGAGIGAAFGGVGAIPGALIGYGLGSIASLPVFYGSQGQQSYEKIKAAQLKAGATPEQAEHEAVIGGHESGAIEAGGEVIADVIPFAKLFKPFVKPAAKAAGTLVKSMFFPTLTQAAKTVGVTVGGEVVTEMGQQAGEDAVEGAHGAGEGATWDSTSRVIMPTAIMSMIPGMAGAASKHQQVNASRDALADPATPKDVRAALATAAVKEMANVSDTTARGFALYAGRQIEADQPIAFENDAFYQRQIAPEASVSDILSAQDADAAIKAATQILALPAPGTIAPGETILATESGTAGTAPQFDALRRQALISEAGAFGQGRGSDISDVLPKEPAPIANDPAALLGRQGQGDPLVPMLEDRRIRNDVADQIAAEEAARKQAELDAIPQQAAEQNTVRAAVERAGALETPTAMQLALERAKAAPAPDVAVTATNEATAATPLPRVVERTPGMVALPQKLAEQRAAANPALEVVRFANVDRATGQPNGKFAFGVAPKIEPVAAPTVEAPAVEEPKPAAQSKSEPVATWFGRRGDGYVSEADARLALPSRQRMEPALSWQIERMPTGKFRLAGYAGETKLANASGQGGNDTSVQGNVGGGVHQLQVVDPVVSLIPVDVVNHLGGKQRAADVLLHDPSVLKDALSARKGNLSVSVLRDLAERIATLRRAELSDGEAAGGNRDFLSALDALDGAVSEVLGGLPNDSSALSLSNDVLAPNVSAPPRAELNVAPEAAVTGNAEVASANGAAKPASDVASNVSHGANVAGSGNSVQAEAKPAKPTEKSRSDVERQVVELRKRKSVLEALRACLGA